MPHPVDHGFVTSDISFGLSITPFGGLTFAGAQNWFDLLSSANVYSVRRKSQVHRSRKSRSSRSGLSRARTVDDEISVSAKKDRPKSMILERNNNLVEDSKQDGKREDTVKGLDKKTSEQSSVLPSRRGPMPKNPEIPVINIIKASNENIPGLLRSGSSDEDSDSDCEEFEDCVYECPGIAASAEDMTVANPLFQERQFESSYRTPELPKQYWKDVFVESV